MTADDRCEALARMIANDVAPWLSARLAEERAAAKAELIADLEALHFEVEGGSCNHCWTGPDSHGNGPSPEWPCATIRAVTKHGGTDEPRPVHRDRETGRPATAYTPPEDIECRGCGRCEVCSPGVEPA